MLKQRGRTSLKWAVIALLILAGCVVVAAASLGMIIYTQWVRVTGSPSRLGYAGSTGRPAEAALVTDAAERTPSASPSITTSPTTTITPFQPRTWTPTPTVTPTPTNTATPTPTSTDTPTVTPLPTHTRPPTKTPLPPTEIPPDALPDSAEIRGVIGHAQALPLSCEARSAADWAGFFGVKVSEIKFQGQLPHSDNPNKGFVGNPADERGYTPPHSYGVHAAPVAALLRKYKLNARSYTGFEWDDVRREVANGQPVIAWVIGNVWTDYHSRIYKAKDGEKVTVAPFEHTVIVTGYGPDSVTVVDNNWRYSVPLKQFLASWGVLKNMVIIHQ